jgi:hypothetical protein
MTFDVGGPVHQVRQEMNAVMFAIMSQVPFYRRGNFLILLPIFVKRILTYLVTAPSHGMLSDDQSTSVQAG